MTTYSIRGPDGKEYSIDGPSGATQDQVIEAIKKRMPQQSAEPPSESTGKAQGRRIMADIDQVNKEEGNLFKGAGETALNLVTGIGSSIVGGLHGYGTTLSAIHDGKSMDDAIREGANTVQNDQQKYTYQPRTGVGKLGTEVVSLPFNIAKSALSSMGGDVGQAINGTQGRIAGEAIGDVLPDVAGTLMGGRAAIRAVPSLRNYVDSRTAILREKAQASAAKFNADDAATLTGEPMPPVEPVQTVTGPQSAAAAEPSNISTPAATDVSMQSEPRGYQMPPQANGVALPESTQIARAKVLQRIGMDSARQSAISGDAMTAATQSQMAKFNEPAGLAAKELFDGERAALHNYAEKIVADTGGSLGMDESSLNSRGQVIAAPFDGLRQYFDAAIKDLYKQADEQSGGKPLTNLENLTGLIETESNFAGKSSNQSLGNGVKAYLREQGIMDKDGNMSPVTPMQAEGIKQYINSQWSPDTSSLAGKIKGIIDDDVFKGAGGDIYAQARNMFKMKKATLDNPDGVFSLMDFDPQTPINRTTPFEKIPNTLTKLPTAQFGHVVDVLNKILDPEYDTPPMLQLQAYDAINEIKAHMANNLLDAGSKFKEQWNAKGVTQELKNNSAKYPMVFDQKELGMIDDLHNAGHILSVNASYPGAAAQLANSRKQGMMSHFMGTIPTAIGGAAGSLMGPIGAAVGAGAGRAIGTSVASSVGEASALKKFNQGIVDLNDQKPVVPDSKLQAYIAATKQRQAMEKLSQAQSVDEAIKAVSDP